jgi:ABC-type glycerol-3-phosphate transport system substrate-binding protein
MKKILKRIGCFVLISALLVMSLTGCSSKKNDSTGGATAAPTNGATAAPTSGANNDKVSIELLTWHGPESTTKFYQGYQQIANDYMAAHSNVDIKIRYEADATYGSVLDTGFAGNSAPDIIQMKSGQRSTYKMNLADLRDALTKQSPYAPDYATWADSFVGGLDSFPAEDSGTVSNALTFVPNDSSPDVFTGSVYIYNKKVIQDAGLDPNKAPVTWTDMFKWLDTLSQDKNIYPIAASNDLGAQSSQIGSLFGENYQDKFFTGDVNDPAFANDLFWDKVYVLTCYDKGDSMPLVNLPYYDALFGLMKQQVTYLQPSWTQNTTETKMLTFVNGKAAMMMTSFYDYDTLVSQFTSDTFPDGYGLFQIPYMGTDTLSYAVQKGWITQAAADAAQPYIVTRTRTGGGSGKQDYGFCVNKTVQNDPAKYAAVIDFLQYLSSPDVQKQYVQTANSLSSVQGVPVSDTVKQFMVQEPADGFASNTLGYFMVEWGDSNWPVLLLKYLSGEADLATTMKAIAAPVWAGDIPSVDALQQAVDTAQTDLDAATTDADKTAKERALKYAQLRQELYMTYYYNMSGNLTAQY